MLNSFNSLFVTHEKPDIIYLYISKQRFQIEKVTGTFIIKVVNLKKKKFGYCWFENYLTALILSNSCHLFIYYIVCKRMIE